MENSVAMGQCCIPCCKRVRPTTGNLLERESFRSSVFWTFGLSQVSSGSFFRPLALNGLLTAVKSRLSKEDLVSSNRRFDGTVIGPLWDSSVLRAIRTPISHSTTGTKTFIDMP